MTDPITDTTNEAPLEPDLPICDPHHHLWRRPSNSYLLDDFLHDVAGGHRIASSVAVECGAMYRETGPPELRPVGETEFLEGIASENARADNRASVAAAIVAYADLTLGDGVAEVLEAHLEASPDRLRGIRYSTMWDASDAFRSVERPGLLRDAAVRKGVACLRRCGLSFDAWLYHPQLPELVELARAFPDLPIILDHIGGPLGLGPYEGRRDEVFRAWSADIAALSGCPNLALKLGGVGSLRSGYDWHTREPGPASIELAEAMRPYFEFCIEKFGADRCMFESNFPVDRISYTYVSVWNAFKIVSRGYSEAERAALFHDTAARVYRVGEP
ncbi:MAG: amidohydrolase family protein [Deltaproteobacteria bacterium]|nr:amidohydrolase family protein [Deltaproteobacteria bacterium]